jgi:hypothetical protein
MLETKKYVVQFFFTADFQATTDSDALEQAARKMGVGFVETRKLDLTVLAAIPLTPRTAPAISAQDVTQTNTAPLSDDELLAPKK